MLKSNTMKLIRRLSIVISLVVLAANGVILYLNPDMHCYPAVTRCRLCGDRVWAWQSYDRRDYKVTVDNPDHVLMGVEMSGLVHCSCKGIPEATAKITSKGVSTPVLGAKETMGITVPR
jgi:hypothetical protein